MTDLQEQVFEIVEHQFKTGNKQIKKLVKKYKLRQDELLEKISKIIVENLSDDGEVVYGSYTVDIASEVKKNLNALAQDEIDFTDELLTSVCRETYTSTAKAFGIAASWDLVRDEFVSAAINTPINGKRYSSRIWDNCDEIANRIYNDVLDCIKNGTRPNHISKRIKDDYGVAAYQARRLVNNELARTVNAAQREIYETSGVVQSVQWCATLDMGTCEDCAKLDGQIFKLNEAPDLPFHVGCRCCLLPIVDGYTPTQRADNITKTNIEYTTYSEWAGQ